jgi:hypothetical protein
MSQPGKHLGVPSRSSFYIAIRPRYSTVQCIFVAYFTSQVLPSLMFRQIPSQKFQNGTRTIGVLSPSQPRSMPPLCFHILTNPFFRKSFCFTSIQNPGGVGYSARNFPTSQRSNVLTPFPATHPQNAPVTPFPATHTGLASCKSFACHTSEKNGGVGGIMINRMRSASPYGAVPGEQYSSSRRFAYDQVLARETRPQAHHTRNGGIERWRAFHQNRLAIPSNLEDIKNHGPRRSHGD